MAYPTGMLSLTLEDLDRSVLQLKNYLVARIAAMAAGNTTASTLIDVHHRL